MRLKLVKEVPLKMTEYHNEIVIHIPYTQFKKKNMISFSLRPLIELENKKPQFLR